MLISWRTLWSRDVPSIHVTYHIKATLLFLLQAYSLWLIASLNKNHPRAKVKELPEGTGESDSFWSLSRKGASLPPFRMVLTERSSSLIFIRLWPVMRCSCGMSLTSLREVYSLHLMRFHDTHPWGIRFTWLEGQTPTDRVTTHKTNLTPRP